MGCDFLCVREDASMEAEFDTEVLGVVVRHGVGGVNGGDHRCEVRWGKGAGCVQRDDFN